MSEYLEKSKKYKGFHYSVLSPEMIQYLHEKTLEMLKIIVPIFEANNIRYMICGGTLLGAMTTGKFIPWDDDVDMCVFDEDYDKALDLLVSNIPSWMFVQWYGTEEKYFHGWAKIRDKGSHVYPDIPSYKENGVWVDLYKLTRTKKTTVPYLIAKEHLDYLNRRCSVGDITEEERDKRIAENCLEDLLDERRKTMEQSDDSEEVFLIWSASKIQINCEWVFPLKKICFEKMDLYSFQRPELYLEKHYGADWIHLPPEEKRRVGINSIIKQ